ncbi:PIR protein [Plasmodium ovale]|uniref:PIR protein n=1 Tax=Plasmodium ovale TaxID=36330 RepID=A0A1D3KWW9_PLAOA|nr:PIR protein [Plasmodium ovale]
MPKPPDSTNFLELLHKSSKELNSEKFYDALNRESSDLSKYYDECENIIVGNHKDEMKKICEKYLRYLESCEVLNNKNFSYDVSKFMNYWLYDKIINIYGKENTTEIETAFGALQLIWRYPKYNPKLSSLNENCKPNLSMVDHYDWKNRKELYDYCVNYEFIAPECKFYPEGCKQHCDYIEKKSNLYEHFEKLCNPKSSDCPEFYDNCKDYNPKVVLGILKCPEKITAPKASFQEDSAMHRPQEQGLRTSARSHDTEPKPETSNIGTKVGHSVLGVAPVLLSATALYRYTPIGSWIRKFGGYNSNSLSNIDGGEMDVLIDNTQESGDMLFGNTGNYISYQPM